MNIETSFIKDYNKDRIEIKAFVYSIVVGSLLVCLIVSMNLLKKDLYYKNNIVIESDQYAVINVLYSDLNIIKNNNYVIINNKKYHYSIKEIELIKDINLYYRIYLNLNNDLLINSINPYKILVRKESIFSYIVRIIEGG